MFTWFLDIFRLNLKNPQEPPSWSWVLRCQLFCPLKLFNVSCSGMDRFAYILYKKILRTISLKQMFIQNLMNNPYSWNMVFTNRPLSKQNLFYEHLSSFNSELLFLRVIYRDICWGFPRTWDTLSHKLPVPFPYEPTDSCGGSSGLFHVLMGFLWDSYDYGTGDFQPFPK